MEESMHPRDQVGGGSGVQRGGRGGHDLELGA